MDIDSYVHVFQQGRKLTNLSVIKTITLVNAYEMSLIDQPTAVRTQK